MAKNCWAFVKHPILSAKENKQIKGQGFLFEKFTKHVTIYQSGHGIMINDHNIKVTNKEQFVKFKRKIDVSDGKKSVKIPSIKHMKKTSKTNRFNDYGFWEYSKDGIITDAHEENWDGKKKNNKVLKWAFNIDHTKIKNNRVYNLGYVISIPGMFRIENGYAENNKNAVTKMQSTISVAHKAKVIEFEVSFEDGIFLKSTPICKILDSADSENGKFIQSQSVSYNALYTKYSFLIKNPRIGNCIVVSWEVQENQ